MKKLLILAIIVGLGVVAYMKAGDLFGGPVMTKAGVRMGASVLEVEKVLGEPLQVLPNFGRELRIYKAKSGQKYMLIFQDDELVEIQS
jgi:hypothetical protein